MNNLLPPDTSLDIGALAGIFNSTTNSYKLLFFISLLEEIEYLSSSNNPDPYINLKSLCINLLRFGWYPYKFFNLSFGSQDKIGRTLGMLKFGLEESAVTNASTKIRLRAKIEEQFYDIEAGFLTRYVPYRILTSFFRTELKGVPDARKNQLVAQLSEQSFETDSPVLYRIVRNRSAIELNPKWYTYIRTNLTIVRGWALYQWANYLQSKNPNTPALIRKIEPPIKRKSLSEQAKFWNVVVEQWPIHCIYSKVRLTPSSFALDHFLPWSFVCHDELWNLIPVCPRANSSKGRSLPDDRFLDPFIEQQVFALSVHQKKSPRLWKRTIQPYVDGLSLTEAEAENSDAIRYALSNKIKSLKSLAQMLGY